MREGPIKNYQLQMIEAQRKQLTGTLYAAKERGYRCEGKQTLTFPASVNYLSIFSRCNELLSFDDRLSEPNPGRLEEVHCLSQPGRKIPLENSLHKDLKCSLKLLKKKPVKAEENIVVRQQKTREGVTVEGKKEQVKPEHDKEFTGIEQSPLSMQFVNSEEEELPSFMADTKNFYNEDEILKELKNQKNLRLNLERDYKSLLKQALENKYRIKQDDSIRATSDNLKSSCKISFIGSQRLKTKGMSEDDNENENDLTVRPGESPARSKQDRRDCMDFGDEERVLDELTAIHEKINSIEGSMRLGEERMKREIMERELSRKERQLERLESKYLGGGAGCRQEERSSFSPNLFILFVLGMLFCKAFFC